MASPRVTAIVCAYYPERFANVDLIVRDLLDGTRPPDAVIILNNNEQHPNRFDDFKTEGVRILSGWNTECRGKYVAAMLTWADYYLLMDDDITVGRRTLESLLEIAHPEIVTANRGTALVEGYPISNALSVDADAIDEPRNVDTIQGCSAFMSHRALARTLLAETTLRVKWPTEGDDILAGFANPGNVTIFPMKGESAWRWLDTGGVAMNRDGGYLSMRDEFAKDVMEALR
jgi:hypothetical protein